MPARPPATAGWAGVVVVVVGLLEVGASVGCCVVVGPFDVACGAEEQAASSATRHSKGDSIRRKWSPQEVIRGDRDQPPVGQVGENARESEHGAFVAEVHAYH